MSCVLAAEVRRKNGSLLLSDKGHYDREIEMLNTQSYTKIDSFVLHRKNIDQVYLINLLHIRLSMITLAEITINQNVLFIAGIL